jgi:hypothetical protein
MYRVCPSIRRLWGELGNFFLRERDGSLLIFARNYPLKSKKDKNDGSLSAYWCRSMKWTTKLSQMTRKEFRTIRVSHSPRGSEVAIFTTRKSKFEGIILSVKGNSMRSSKTISFTHPPTRQRPNGFHDHLLQRRGFRTKLAINHRIWSMRRNPVLSTSLINDLRNRQLFAFWASLQPHKGPYTSPDIATWRTHCAKPHYCLLFPTDRQ